VHKDRHRLYVNFFSRNFNYHKLLPNRKLELFVNSSSSFGTLVACILSNEIEEDGIRRTQLELPLQ